MKYALDSRKGRRDHVAPHAGAWIEIAMVTGELAGQLSLPMRERGLKFFSRPGPEQFTQVAPHAGAWIEISIFSGTFPPPVVAPHAGSAD